MSEHLHYDKKASDMNHDERTEIYRIFEGYSEYYQRLTEKYSHQQIMQAFILNSGGLGVIVAHMGACTANLKTLLSFLAVFAFILGILCNTIVIFIERYRFIDKGKKNDEVFAEFQIDKKTGKEYFESSRKTEYADCLVNVFEFFSYLTFLIGLVLSIFSFI